MRTGYTVSARARCDRSLQSLRPWLRTCQPGKQVIHYTVLRARYSLLHILATRAAEVLSRQGSLFLNAHQISHFGSKSPTGTESVAPHDLETSRLHLLNTSNQNAVRIAAFYELTG